MAFRVDSDAQKTRRIRRQVRGVKGREAKGEGRQKRSKITSLEGCYGSDPLFESLR